MAFLASTVEASHYSSGRALRTCIPLSNYYHQLLQSAIMFKQVPRAVFYMLTSLHSVISLAAAHAACSHLLHAVAAYDDFIPVFSYTCLLFVELTVASRLGHCSMALGLLFAGFK